MRFITLTITMWKLTIAIFIFRCKTTTDLNRHVALHEQRNDKEQYICDVEGCDYQSTGYHTMTKHHTEQHGVS